MTRLWHHNDHEALQETVIRSPSSDITDHCPRAFQDLHGFPPKCLLQQCCQVPASSIVNLRPLLAGLGDMVVQVLTCAGRASLPSPCTELTPWGTLSLLQVSQHLPLLHTRQMCLQQVFLLHTGAVCVLYLLNIQSPDREILVFARIPEKRQETFLKVVCLVDKINSIKSAKRPKHKPGLCLHCHQGRGVMMTAN